MLLISVIGIMNLILLIMSWFTFRVSPKTSCKKAFMSLFVPFALFKHFRIDAYVLDLSVYYSINQDFNLTDLYSYRGTFKPPTLPSSISRLGCLSTATRPCCFFSTHQYHWLFAPDYVVASKNVVIIEDWHSMDVTWITENEVSWVYWRFWMTI